MRKASNKVTMNVSCYIRFTFFVSVQIDVAIVTFDVLQHLQLKY